MSINNWKDKQTVAYLYDGILLSNKKEWTTDTHKNMDESQYNYAELKKSDFPPTEKKNNCVILFIQKHEILENAN